MAILVTGGAGYVGSHTVHLLNRLGYRLAVVDNLSTGFQAAVPENVHFYRGDIRDRDFLDAVFRTETVEGVIHFAACSQVGESMAHPLRYYNNNLGGTETLLECMVEHGVKIIVFSSSAAVYGEPEQIPIQETAPTAPTNCYGETKIAMERMMHWTEVAHGLRYVALRYFNACGAQRDGQIGEAHTPETHLIPLVLQVANGQRESVSIFGTDYPTADGTCVRDYVHVEDLAQAHLLALEYLLHGGESQRINLGSGSGFSVREIIQAARRVTGHAIPAVEQPRRAGDPAVLVAGIEKAASILGWKPQCSDLEYVMTSAWQWHRTHPHGFAK